MEDKETNMIIPHMVPNGYTKYAYLQGFEFEL